MLDPNYAYRTINAVNLWTAPLRGLKTGLELHTRAPYSRHLMLSYSWKNGHISSLKTLSQKCPLHSQDIYTMFVVRFFLSLSTLDRPVVAKRVFAQSAITRQKVLESSRWLPGIDLCNLCLRLIMNFVLLGLRINLQWLRLFVRPASMTVVLLQQILMTWNLIKNHTVDQPITVNTTYQPYENPNQRAQSTPFLA